MRLAQATFFHQADLTLVVAVAAKRGRIERAHAHGVVAFVGKRSEVQQLTELLKKVATSPRVSAALGLGESLGSNRSHRYLLTKSQFCRRSFHFRTSFH